MGHTQPEAVLRRDEQRYRSLVQATAAIVWNTPASGEFESDQPEWTTFTGQGFEQLKGWGWLDAVHPADRPNTARVWSAAVASRSMYQVEHRLRRHDGQYRHMMVRAVPILEDGEILEWVGVHTDIHDQKLAEEELRRARDAANAASRAKSEFLANMSHEIRTPMNGIIGMTELALDTELTAEQREDLEAVKLSANYLLAVINDILDFSKIEAGKLDLDPIDFSLRDHLEETVTTLALRAHAKGLELLCEVDEDVPDVLVGDPCRLRQIIVNLIGNAVKFTGQGEVVVKVQNEEKAEEKSTSSSCTLHFSVRDTGIGIPAPKLGLLFQAFSQVDSSTTRKFGGTGLGLAISAQLVRLMAGRVWVESEEGKGSTFHFTARFGLSRKPYERQAPDLTRVRDLPVLVVDDNPTNRSLLRALLTKWGMRPTLVEGGTQALDALRQAAEEGRPFAIVLLDHLMPEMDGLMLAEQIQRNPHLAGSVLMMLSSADRRETSARCRERGVKAYLTKPVKRGELLNALAAGIGAGAPVLGQPAVPSNALAACERGLSLLLAEDNVVNQRLAVRLLEKRGHKVRVVGNGKEVLGALFGEGNPAEPAPFNVVLMDVMMPEMDGFETTRIIRAREKGGGSHIPIIAMTAHAMKGDRERCLEVGMDGYISKPLQPGELFETVESMARLFSGVPTSARQAAPDRCGGI
jgi:PAS domain S-box-containing protein